MAFIDDWDVFVEEVYEGTATAYNLSVTGAFLYDYTFADLDKLLHESFGVLTPDSVTWKKAVEFRQSLGRFSGVKTFDQAKELTLNVFTDKGTKRPFKEYKQIADELGVTYNKTYLKVEQDMVFQQSQNTQSWLGFEEEKDLFPLLKYNTVLDGRVRKSHQDLEGITRPVNDPIWNSITPANGWRCRCQLVQLMDDEGIKTSDKLLSSKTNLIDKDFKKDSLFAHNPAKVDYIFKEKGKDKHPYYNVPRQYKDLEADNFGFPIPKNYNDGI